MGIGKWGQIGVASRHWAAELRWSSVGRFVCRRTSIGPAEAAGPAERGVALAFGVNASGEARPRRARVVTRWHHPWGGGSEKLVRG